MADRGEVITVDGQPALVLDPAPARGTRWAHIFATRQTVVVKLRHGSWTPA